MNEYTGYQTLRLDRNSPDCNLQDDMIEALDGVLAIVSLLVDQDHQNADLREVLRTAKREAERARCLWDECENRRQAET